jgi:hypothetical protein
VLFLSLTLVMLIAGSYCAITSSADPMSVPYDSSGNGCGVTYPHHPYIYFPSPQYDVPLP